MKKSYWLFAVPIGLATAYLVYEETAGLGNVQRLPPGPAITVPPDASPREPAIRERAIRRPEKKSLHPAPVMPERRPTGSRSVEEQELDDVGPWEFHEMEKVERGGR